MARSPKNRGNRRSNQRSSQHTKPGRSPNRSEPQGFSGPGMRQLFDAVLPMQGDDRKQFFNQASTGLVIGLALGGAMLGGSLAGLFGAIVGFGIGATVGGLFVEKQRYYRR